MPVELLMIAASIVLGVVICAVLTTPIVKRFMDRFDKREAGRWYRRGS